MKKFNFIISIAYVFIMLSLLCLSVSASEVGTYFDATKNQLVISGSIGSDEMTPVTIHISDYHQASLPPTFSKENPPLVSELVFTEENGTVTVTVLLSKIFRNNKYTVHFYSTEDNGDSFYASSHFVYFNPESLEALEAVKRINDASKIDFQTYKNAISTNAMSLGIDLSQYTSHFEYASDITFSLISKMPDKKYTTTSFKDTFFSSVAASIIKNDGDVNGAVSNYFANFGTTYDAYSALPTEEKEILNELLKFADYKSAFLSDIYGELLSVSNIKAEKILDKFIEKVTNNDIFGVSTSDVTYNEISQTYRNLVFKEMFDERNTYTSSSDVLDSFQRNTLEILRLYPKNTPSPSAPSGPSGSPSSTIVGGGSKTDVPNVKPENPPTPSQLIFNDTKNHWGAESINYLVSLKSTNGYPDGSFKPDNPVTRAEFAKIVCASFNISGSYKPIYKDVTENDWYAQSVCALSGMSIINGYNMSFSPNSYIKREDAAVILSRLLEHLNINIPKAKSSFNDMSSISDYALVSVEKMSEAGIIKGDENSAFNPSGNLTRAEASAIIHRTHTLCKGGLK